MILWLSTQSKEARSWIEKAIAEEHRLEVVEGSTWVVYYKIPDGAPNPCTWARDNIPGLNNLAGNTIIGVMSYTGGFGDDSLHDKISEWERAFRTGEAGTDSETNPDKSGD